MREGGGPGLRVPLPTEPSGRGGTVAAVGAAQRGARPPAPAGQRLPEDPGRAALSRAPAARGPPAARPTAPLRAAQRTLTLGSYLALSESPEKAQLPGGMDLKVSPPAVWGSTLPASDPRPTWGPGIAGLRGGAGLRGRVGRLHRVR